MNRVLVDRELFEVTLEPFTQTLKVGNGVERFVVEEGLLHHFLHDELFQDVLHRGHADARLMRQRAQIHRAFGQQGRIDGDLILCPSGPGQDGADSQGKKIAHNGADDSPFS